MKKEKEEKLKELAKTFLEYWERNPDIPLGLLRAGYLHVVKDDLDKEFAKNILPLLSPPRATTNEGIANGSINYIWKTQNQKS